MDTAGIEDKQTVALGVNLFVADAFKLINREITSTNKEHAKKHFNASVEFHKSVGNKDYEINAESLKILSTYGLVKQKKVKSHIRNILQEQQER